MALVPHPNLSVSYLGVAGYYYYNTGTLKVYSYTYRLYWPSGTATSALIEL